MFVAHVDDLDYCARLYSSEVKHYEHVACVLEIKITFENQIKKKLVTKVLNKIKRQEGFRQYLINTINAEIEKQYAEIQTMQRYLHTIRNYNYREYKQDTWYSGGKLLIRLNMDDLYSKEKLLQDMEFLVDEFIKKHCTNVQITTRNNIKNVY